MNIHLDADVLNYIKQHAIKNNLDRYQIINAILRAYMEQFPLPQTNKHKD